MDAVIEVVGLCKAFGDLVVLDDVNLRADRGQVLALLGPNGAGKTTLVRIASTVIPADGGTVRIAGHDVRRDPAAVRAAISLTGQATSIDDTLTGEENLDLVATLAHLPRAGRRAAVAEQLERFDLAGAARRRVATYSGGMRRRLDLAASLLSRPAVLFLDEPTTGLDPRSRLDLWDVIRSTVADGTTVLLTTQYLDEADELADRVAVLDAGHVIADGTADELKALVGSAYVEVLRRDGHVDRVPTDGSMADVRRILAGLDDTAVAEWSVRTPTLDDAFLHLTGHGAVAVTTGDLA
jgi:ABC-2 type transport system ATP-binding protein